MFYLLEPLRPELSAVRIAQSLDQLRKEIAAIVVPTKRGDMSCTVSVGWMTTDDGGDETLTERAVMGMVEAAVGAAKVHGRNRVVRYSPEVEKAQRRSLRDDCSVCKASFTVEVPVNSSHSDRLYCPNCGERLARPPVTDAPASATPKSPPG